jgi:hypothetical protein
MFTRALHRALSWYRSIEPIPVYLTSLRSILILPSHQCLGLRSGFFPSGFPAKILHVFFFSPRCATCPDHLILSDLIILIILGEDYKLWRSSLCSILQPPVTSSLFNLNILLSALFSNTLSLCFSLNVRDQVSHPYRTTSKIIFFYILVFMYII